MGRLSTFAKNRILNMRFQKCFRIKQIAQALIAEDNIKVSRKSISTFLKKYIETKSINDKPRSGRNKKLTPEEINLIGEVTRLNRDITAPKIKEYLNLNVSTYTILRASKLFEWNKFNPNSNQAKREAAMQRKVSTDERKRPDRKRSNKKQLSPQSANGLIDALNDDSSTGKSNIQIKNSISNISMNEGESQDIKEENKLPGYYFHSFNFIKLV
jgi:transposase